MPACFFLPRAACLPLFLTIYLQTLFLCHYPFSHALHYVPLPAAAREHRVLLRGVYTGPITPAPLNNISGEALEGLSLQADGRGGGGTACVKPHPILGTGGRTALRAAAGACGSLLPTAVESPWAAVGGAIWPRAGAAFRHFRPLSCRALHGAAAPGCSVPSPLCQQLLRALHSLQHPSAFCSAARVSSRLARMRLLAFSLPWTQTGRGRRGRDDISIP